MKAKALPTDRIPPQFKERDGSYLKLKTSRCLWSQRDTSRTGDRVFKRISSSLPNDAIPLRSVGPLTPSHLSRAVGTFTSRRRTSPIHALVMSVVNRAASALPRTMISKFVLRVGNSFELIR